MNRPGHDRAAASVSREASRVVEDAQLTIQQVSALLRLPAATVRSWERRYGVPTPARSSGGHRRYTTGQLNMLRRMRDLIAGGERSVEAAALVRAGYGAKPEPLIDAFLHAARDLAPAGIAQTLDAACRSLGLDRTVDEVLIPAMRRVGDGWQAGRVDVAHEHLASNASRAWLSKLDAPAPLRPVPPIILSCGPNDHHTLGLEAFGALLRHRRYDCRLLGARTPIDSLELAIEDTDAAAVVLVCHSTAGRATAVAALNCAQLLCTRVFYAGAGFDSVRARQGVPGHYLGTNFTDAADLVEHALKASSADRPLTTTVEGATQQSRTTVNTATTTTPTSSDPTDTSTG